MKKLKSHLPIIIPPILLLTFTFCIFGPMEMLMTNASSIWFLPSEALPSVLGLFTVVFLVISVVELLIACMFPKAVQYLSASTLGLSLATYVQGNFTFVDYGNMGGVSVDWNGFGIWPIVNTLLWIVLIALPIIVLVLKKKIFIQAYQYVCIGLLAVQCITLGTVALTTSGNVEKSSFYLTTENEFTFSKNKDNIIIFTVDGFDGEDFLPAINEIPECKPSFDGFTYYQDVLGASLYSFEGGINLLTGNQMEGSGSFDENVIRCYDESAIWKALSENDFSSNLYVNLPKMVSPTILDSLENVEFQEKTIGDKMKFTELIYKMVSFRYMPHIIKPLFWMSTSDFDEVATTSETSPEIFNWSNLTFYHSLKDGKLVAEETEESQYKFYWLHGPHEPIVMDANCEELPERVEMNASNFKEAQFEQSKGVLKMFATLLEELKTQGIYDNTTIIFCSDHGWDNRPNPLLLIKPKDSHGELKISTVPVSMIEDFTNTMVSIISNDETQTDTIFTLTQDQLRDRPFYSYGMDSEGVHYTARDVSYFPSGAFIPVKIGLTDGNGTCQTKLSYNSYEDVFTEGWFGSTGAGRWALQNAKIVFPVDQSVDVQITLTGNRFLPSGEIEVLYNGTKVEVWDTDNSEFVAVLPKDLMASGGSQTVTLHTPNITSPSEAENGSTDTRLLSMYVEAIRLDVIEEVVPDTSIYSIGKELLFGVEHGEEGVSYFTSGLSYQQEGGVWTDGEEATFVASLANEPEKNLQMTIDAIVYKGKTGRQQVIIYAGDQKIYSESLVEGLSTISFEIDKKYVMDKQLSLTFQFPDSIAPKEVEENQDPRQIALYFQKIIIK